MRGGAEAVRESIERSLADLGTGYIDLMLIHWPVADKIRETWQIMEEFVDCGKIRSIGLSNFNPSHIDEVLSFARIRPVLNQIEIHPYMTQFNVSGYNFRNGIQTEAWGPLGQGVTGELNDPAILKIAKRHNKSAAQVILRWHMQRGLITMPRCDNPEYVRENAAIFDFELSPAEMEIISGLNRNQRTNEKNDPENFPVVIQLYSIRNPRFDLQNSHNKGQEQTCLFVYHKIFNFNCLCLRIRPSAYVELACQARL